MNHNSGSLIDQIYVKFSHRSTYSYSGILDIDISDHMPIFSTLYHLNQNFDKTRNVTIKKRWPDNIENIRGDLNVIDWDNMFVGENFEERFEKFMSILQNTLDNNISSREVKYRNISTRRLNG